MSEACILQTDATPFTVPIWWPVAPREVLWPAGAMLRSGRHPFSGASSPGGMVICPVYRSPSKFQLPRWASACPACMGPVRVSPAWCWVVLLLGVGKGPRLPGGFAPALH
ncbi:hypothetical protein AMECASPLE_023573 [Ameca splendens]|uniref:Uncharacterized protein n=1 Tax=Ameca splendens TaxID=208324 RepID=A0ABV0XT89_9TELE